MTSYDHNNFVSDQVKNPKTETSERKENSNDTCNSKQNG